MPPHPDAQRRAEEAQKHALIVHDPTDTQKIGWFTIICTLLNRMIGELNPTDNPYQIANVPTCLGSGIFVSPAIVLRGTGSVGASLCLWALGAVAGIAGLLVWLELGLSIPKFQPPDAVNGERHLICIPRNGGEKNYVRPSEKSNSNTNSNALIKLARIHL